MASMPITTPPASRTAKIVLTAPRSARRRLISRDSPGQPPHFITAVDESVAGSASPAPNRLMAGSRRIHSKDVEALTVALPPAVPQMVAVVLNRQARG